MNCQCSKTIVVDTTVNPLTN